MKASILFKQYVWLVDTIQRCKRITLADLNERWLRTELSEGRPLSRTTFNRHRNEVEEIFGITIGCDADNRYYIVNSNLLRTDTVQQWMLSTLTVSNIVGEARNLHDRILLESIPTEGELLRQIVEAMQRGVLINITYRRYGSTTDASWTIAPYCIKLFRRRWYLVGIIRSTGFQPVNYGDTGTLPVSLEPSTEIKDWHRRFHSVPHRKNKALQSITFRLYDSLPKEVIEEIKLKLDIKKEDPTRNSKQYQRLQQKIAEYEDAGYGQCFLRDERIAAIMQDTLKHFDGERYQLICWCIMPNHVHVLIEVNEGWSLSRIMHGWRSYTANEANRILGRTGKFWMEEYYDRYIRDDNHLQNTINYILNNPANAGLDEWPWVGDRSTGFQPVLQAGGLFPGSTGSQPVLQAGSLYPITLSFDRITSLSLTDEPFTVDPDFDAEAFFSEYFGVMTDDRIPLQRIVLRAFGNERFALRDLPLHPSQQLVEDNGEYVDFELFLRPTSDFLAHILSRGRWVKVISPESIAQRISEMHQEAL
ncbi:MAG: WYL domain-containing protein [Bacteroidales bacterium]|nr:WYL domain-containing protein [Bacteroidales bacterium]